ncbi:MAG: hypothetical protein Q8P67_12730 [archaeon]|nr:hypothetical protein [archaeon]
MRADDQEEKSTIDGHLWLRLFSFIFKRKSKEKEKTNPEKKRGFKERWHHPLL